ncbi:hypothetical protein DRO61_02675, partial [Candidatus Bathyarchaeota archaeon]
MEKKYKRESKYPEAMVEEYIKHVVDWPQIPTMNKKLIVEGSSPGHFFRTLWRRFGIEKMPPATIKEQADAMIDCAKAGAAAVHTHINSSTKDSCENGPYHALDADLEGDIFDKVFEEVDV